MPNFWLAVLLVYVFGTKMGVFPFGPGGASSYILSCLVLGTFAGCGLIPVIRSGVLGLLREIPTMFGGFLSGAVVVETVFDWPGIGRLANRAAITGDYRVSDSPLLNISEYPVLLGAVLEAVAMTLALKLVGDLLAVRAKVSINTEEDVQLEQESPAVPGVAGTQLRSDARRVPWVSLIILGIIFLVGFFAPLIVDDPLEILARDPLLLPGPGHLLGTDALGRDVLSRVIWGARASLVVAFSSTLLIGAVGVSLGLISGWVGG